MKRAKVVLSREYLLVMPDGGGERKIVWTQPALG